MYKTLTSLILTGAAFSLLVGTALAADIAPEPVPALGGLYVGAFGGATWFTENGTEFTFTDPSPDVTGEVSLDTDAGWLVGGVLGYNWADTGLRTELELSYSQANLDGFDIDWDNNFNGPDGDDLDFDGDVSVTYIFGNLWYGFGNMMNMGGLSPYIGGGLGVGFVNVDVDAIEDVEINASGDETGFAYQLGAGLMWNVSDNVALDLGYRFRGVALDDYDEALTSHNVLLGLNFGF